MFKNKTADYIYVTIQLALFVLYWWQPGAMQKIFPEIWKFIGLVLTCLSLVIILIAFLQLNKNLTMLPTPVKNAKLITNGIFKYIRHPIYTGIFLFATGWALMDMQFSRLFIAFLILLLFEIKSNYEERKLAEQFSEYETYKKQTGKFFPYLKNRHTNGTTSP